MFAVLETSDRHVDMVSVIVDSFRVTFMLRVNSSGRFLPAPGNYRQTVPEGGMSMFGKLEGVVDIWIAYSYSLYFSDQFSCIKFLNLSYGLKYIEFQSLNHFKQFSEFLFIIISTLSRTLSKT